MSESEIQRLQDRITKMTERKGRVLGVIAELEVIIADTDVDIQACKLQLDAERYEQWAG